MNKCRDQPYPGSANTLSDKNLEMCCDISILSLLQDIIIDGVGRKDLLILRMFHDKSSETKDK